MRAVTFRLPDDLVFRLRGVSERTGVPQARIVSDGLRVALDAREFQLEALRGGFSEDVTLDAATLVVGDEPVGVLGCPVAGCEFSAPSAAARCPAHGRTVR